MRRYPAYKDSGVEWLGEVPEGWEVRPIKGAFDVVGGTTPKSDVPEYWDGNISWVTPADLSNLPSRFIYESGRQITEDGLGSCGTTIVPPGSIVLSVRAPIGSLAIAAREVCTNQGCKALVPTARAHSDFYYFVLEAAREALNILGRGSTFLELSGDQLAAFRVPLPPLPEQAAIAAFLDRETTKIDALVAEQRRLIDLLKEKRQAVISQAVTKGLNPNAPLKPSGVDWLGDVPEGWGVKRLRFLCKIETGTSDTQDANDDFEFPFFVRSQTVERISHFTHDCEAVMTSGDGAGVGKIFHHFKGKFSAHQRVYIFTNFDGVSGEFFFNYLRANFFKVALEGGAKSTVDSLRRPLIANFWMTVPLPAEQEEILSYIADIEGQYAVLTTAAETAITLLQERRAALISAAVTGKIDVRPLAANEEEAA